eukprot:TRINITY_DN484_c0_g4_i5.p1 TRINITY_DN484_c0_g4~~TRINITY_DN484_c0_g4_i5.p1  ORF type:complete len:198 (+),score=89.01 TRINITY_DN484_c0_g4_i5:67-660(+)
MSVKCVIVGDGAVGKTCMLISYTQGKFPVEYVPTVFDNYEKTLTIDNKDIKVSLWDTAGQEGYARIRTLSYPKTDIFMLCYSVVNLTSFINVKERWLIELKHHCPNVPILLVGTKIDLRDELNNSSSSSNNSENKQTTSIEQGSILATEIGALSYFECSAFTQYNIQQVFDQAVISVISPSKRKNKSIKTKSNCLVL